MLTHGGDVIIFSKETGGRDQVWADVAVLVEERAKERTAS